MAGDPLDPGALEGDALARWYRRSPWDLEQEGRAAQAKRWEDFRSWVTAASSQQPSDPSGLEGATGRLSSDAEPNQDSADETFWGGPSGGSGEGQFILIGSKTPRHRRGWERREGVDWPKTEAGRNFDAHHIVAKADGGPDTLDNIEPMHPEEHRAMHMNGGDFSRWAKLRWRFRLPEGGELGALGLMSIVPEITGILSGRIRTDSFDHFSSDSMGIPSPEDTWRAREEFRKKHFPDSAPGTPWT